VDGVKEIRIGRSEGGRGKKRKSKRERRVGRGGKGRWMWEGGWSRGGGMAQGGGEEIEEGGGRRGRRWRRGEMGG